MSDKSMGQKHRPEKEKVEERRDAGIARMLKTPPKPHKDMKKGKPKKNRGKNSSSEKS